MPGPRTWLLGAGLAAAVALAQPLPALAAEGSAEWSADQVRAERQRIAEARAAVQARHAAAELACAGQFQLNRCLAEAAAERRQALDRLQRDQLALDDQARRRRAEQRLAAIERRREEAAARGATAASAPLAPRPGARPASGPQPTDRARAPGAVPMVDASAGPRPEQRVRSRPAAPDASDASVQRAAEARRRAQASAERQAAAAARAKALARQQAERDARRPPAAGLPPLPAPPRSAASAPGAPLSPSGAR